MAYTQEELEIYRKVRHELLKEDARYYVKDYISYERSIAPWDIDESELEEYDYERLASEYEEKESRDSDSNYTWQCIVNDYMEDYGYESEDEDE